MTRILRTVLATVMWSGAPGLPIRAALSQTVPPSFDCAKARTRSEVAICADDHLAQLDQAGAIAFQQIPADYRKQARQARAEFLADRDACGDDRRCILDQQIAALQSYDGFGPKVPVPPWVGAFRATLVTQSHRPLVDHWPSLVGDCTRTKIAAITTRFGDSLKAPPSDDFDPGSAVGFADKGYQVTYSYEPAIAASAIGDAVLVCLVSLPKDCPKGDERGKLFSTTNLRTSGSWVMADSQHMCGGA